MLVIFTNFPRIFGDSFFPWLLSTSELFNELFFSFLIFPQLNEFDRQQWEICNIFVYVGIITKIT